MMKGQAMQYYFKVIYTISLRPYLVVSRFPVVQLVNHFLPGFPKWAVLEGYMRIIYLSRIL